MNQEETLYIIPARKNSKRLKNKNLLQLGNKKLIERTIEFTLKISNRSNIYLSTDSREIQKIGKKYGIYCPNLRPSYLSNSKSRSADVCIHAIHTFEKKKKIKIKNVVLLQPTSPFRSLKLYYQTCNLFKKNLNSTVTVSPFNNKKIVNNKGITLKMFMLKSSGLYEINGNLYIILAKELIKKKSFFSKNLNISVTNSKKLSLDIDTIYDLEKAKKFL